MKFKKLTLKSESKLISSWQENCDEPVVSIHCITYNHEGYIEDAINGFLIQETTFPFEILIHDDASTDRTADIIRKYEKDYPNIIKPIYQLENQYSKGISVSATYNLPRAKGRYIAACEGDDYWTDPTKLQKQVDYLEANPDVVISSFDAKVIDSQGNLISESKLPQAHHKDYSSEELMQGKAWLLTMNWVFRNIDFGYIPERNKVLNGDKFLTSILGQYGGSHHHTDIKPSIYRQHRGGVWSSLDDEEKLEAHINTYFWMYKYYKRISKPEVANVFYNNFESLTANLSKRKGSNSLSFKVAYESFNKVESTINNIPKNKKYLIYGYTSVGRYIKENLRNSFIGFIDRDAKIIDKPYVYSLEEVDLLEFDNIIISLLARHSSLAFSLEKYISQSKVLYFNQDLEILTMKNSIK